MPIDTNVGKLSLSDGYRSARRTTSVLCGIALAWSTAQFDVRVLNLGFGASIDLSNASIPFALLAGIAYMAVRQTIEFAMQSVEVRRWTYARLDYRLSAFLVRATLLLLASGALYRSVETIAYAALGAIILLLAAGTLLFVGTMVVMPILLYVRSRQGRTSVASRAIEAMAWAQVVTLVIVIMLVIVAGIASVVYEPLRSMWSVPPSAASASLLVGVTILLIISFGAQGAWYAKVFAEPPDHIEVAPLDWTGFVRR